MGYQCERQRLLLSLGGRPGWQVPGNPAPGESLWGQSYPVLGPGGRQHPRSQVNLQGPEFKERKCGPGQGEPLGLQWSDADRSLNLCLNCYKVSTDQKFPTWDLIF